MQILGIDVGGSGIKGAVVDTDTGQLMTERCRIDTPKPATPGSVAVVIERIAANFSWQGPIGVGFPAAMQNGVARTAANVDKTFIGTDLSALFGQATGCNVKVINDADAGGLAEIAFGDIAGRSGLVIFITIGTGLGSAILQNGKIVPNSELGHLWLSNGKEAERYASDAVRKRKDLSWKAWARRFDLFLNTLDGLFFPDLYVLGGGASKKLDYFGKHLTTATPFRPASFFNQAGIVGAALAGRPD